MESEKEIYQNRAVPVQDGDGNILTADTTECERCCEELVFAMRDKTHEFSLGLSTVLRCLAIAEKEGYVPKLPTEWWQTLRKYEAL